MGIDRILLLVAAQRDDDRDALAKALAAEGARALASIGSTATGTVAVNVPPRPGVAPDEGTYELVLKRGLTNGVLLGGFDAVLDLTVPDADIGRTGGALGEVVRALGDLIDPARSAAVGGRVHVIMEGTGKIQLFYCMRRLADVTHETFSSYWREQHADVGKVTPGLAGYRQLHADESVSASLATAAGVGIADFDGVALEWFAEMADFITAAGSPPSHAIKAKASEGNFNDIDRATAIITTWEELSADV
jgi:hypothetical protein